MNSDIKARSPQKTYSVRQKCASHIAIQDCTDRRKIMIKLVDSSPAISVDELDKIEALLGVSF
ncbi:TPA: hypothetical protein ACPUPS_004910, partial [Enterobacter cloacae]